MNRTNKLKWDSELIIIQYVNLKIWSVEINVEENTVQSYST